MFYNALGCDTLLKRVSGQYTVLQRVKIQSAPTGNRARAHRAVGEDSTTEPTIRVQIRASA